jgi:hypothetical protein
MLNAVIFIYMIRAESDAKVHGPHQHFNQHLDNLVSGVGSRLYSFYNAQLGSPGRGARGAGRGARACLKPATP